MELKDIQSFIKFVSRSGVSEIKLEMKDLKLTIRTDSVRSRVDGMPEYGMPMQGHQLLHVPTPTQSMESKNEKDEGSSKEEDNYITVKSPMIGTFYRRSSPDKEPFVEVGAVVSDETVLCMIEAMKLFNEIESEVSGKIVKILVEDSSPVEFDQPLFLIDPS